jgi:hypothetical protein
MSVQTCIILHCAGIEKYSGRIACSVNIIPLDRQQREAGKNLCLYRQYKETGDKPAFGGYASSRLGEIRFVSA